mmetsp:Transcript_98923/g.284141  ORF Transcript_98923/g.284141 Transcript_98923/m.284141 type:complete len:90 (+) Transcript_98923:974-1243(+)
MLQQEGRAESISTRQMSMTENLDTPGHLTDCSEKTTVTHTMHAENTCSLAAGPLLLASRSAAKLRSELDKGDTQVPTAKSTPICSSVRP